MADVYKGFEPSGVLRAEIALPDKKYQPIHRLRIFKKELLRQVTALPGVSAGALNSNTPASNVDNPSTLFTVESSPVQKATEIPSADVEITSPNYFQALHIALLTGRSFTDADVASAPPVAVISEGLAKRFWPDGAALGRRFKLGAPDSDRPWLTVIGIVCDVRQNWWNPPGRPVIYQSFLQNPERGMTLLLRASSSPQNYAGPLREIVRNLDPEVAVNGLTTLEREVADSIAIVRIMGMLGYSSRRAGTSAIGVYGGSLKVWRSAGEFGIRLALGARPADSLRQVVWHSLKLTSIGLAIALPLSLLISRAVSHYVFGLITTNLGVPLFFAAILMVVGVIAAYLPAARAMHVDPIVTLRHE